MQFRKKLLFAGILVLVIMLLSAVFWVSPAAVAVYDSVFFYPFQWLRAMLLGFIPFSVGDALYVAGGAGLLWIVIKWIRYIFKFKTSKYLLAASLLHTIITILWVYLLFILGWGANYNKQPLAKDWQLYDNSDTMRLSLYDSLLVERMNILAPSYRPLSLTELNTDARQYYNTRTDCRLKRFGLGIKPSLFNYFIDRISIEGYYNPFTGEGQVSSLPGFIMPFVICHEMAHQAGIAAEGDANLMAYAVATASGNTTFEYSATFNIWEYVDRRLFRKDSLLAKKLEARLHPIIQRHVAIMDSLGKLSDNGFNEYSAAMYDGYLKMQQQKEGIKSYGSIVKNAWLLEKKRLKSRNRLIHVP